MPSPTLQPLMAFVPPTGTGGPASRWTRSRTIAIAAGVGVVVGAGVIATVLMGGSRGHVQADRITTAGPSELSFVAAANAVCTTDWAHRSAALRVSLGKTTGSTLSAMTVGIETTANTRLVSDVTSIAHPSVDGSELAAITSATTALNARWATRLAHPELAGATDTLAAFDAGAVALSTDYNVAGLPDCFPISAQTLS